MSQLRTNNRTLMSVIVVMVLCFCVSALAAPIDAAPDAGRESMFSLIRKGGVVMIPLGLASVLALAFAIERFISLRRDKIIPPDFMKRIVELVETDPSGDAAIKFCAQTERPAAHIMKAGLLGLLKSGDAAEKAIEDAGAREASKMKRSLRILSVIATVSPLLGLLGTVYGMISAFQTASAVGMGKADVLAKGIYEALVTTAAGLTIAIPVLLAYQYLSSRVDSIVDDLDEIGIEFMTSCSKNT